MERGASLEDQGPERKQHHWDTGSKARGRGKCEKWLPVFSSNPPSPPTPSTVPLLVETACKLEGGEPGESGVDLNTLAAGWQQLCTTSPLHDSTLPHHSLHTTLLTPPHTCQTLHTSLLRDTHSLPDDPQTSL